MITTRQLQSFRCADLHTISTIVPRTPFPTIWRQRPGRQSLSETLRKQRSQVSLRLTLPSSLLVKSLEAFSGCHIVNCPVMAQVLLSETRSVDRLSWSQANLVALQPHSKTDQQAQICIVEPSSLQVPSISAWLSRAQYHLQALLGQFQASSPLSNAAYETGSPVGAYKPSAVST